MILDEAIKRYTDNAEYERTHGNLQGCLDFRQLVDWLKDYKRLKEQEPKTEWIPVSGKLPESECLLCDNEGLIFIGSYLKHCKWFEDYDENIIDDVVAWMPLPPCYQGGMI